MNKKTFFLKLFLIFLPVILILAFPIFVLVVSGEFSQPDTVLAEQNASNQNILYAPAYTDFEAYYRMQGVLLHQPEVLALGNSRILDIRSEYFKPGVTSYDAGLLAKGIQEYRQVLDRIPKATQPKVMIMVLEQSQFDYWERDFNGYYNLPAQLVYQKPLNYILNVTIRSWPLIYGDYFQKKFSIRQLWQDRHDNTRIGLLAKIDNEGFRKDGSYRNGRYVDHPHDPRLYDSNNFSDTFGLIALKSGYFRYNTYDGLSEQALDETDAILAEAKARGIYVIAYMPPYAPTVYKKMLTDPAYHYIFQIEDKARPIFEKYGFELYNFNDPASLGAKDSEFFDGYHQGEKVYVRLMLYMAKHSSVLGKLVDIPTLQKKLDASTKDYDVFGN